MHKNIFTITTAFFITCTILCAASPAEAANDGFVSAKKIQSRYFNIYLENGADIMELAARISVPPSIRSIVMDPLAASSGDDISNQFDLLFLAVSEIMDIRLRDFKIKIKVCKDAPSLFETSKNLFGKEVKAGGFYVAALDTIYIDARNVNIHIAGHELSHAIQMHYFVVPIPVKIQEVLAGYVEYELRKYSNTLPQRQ